MIERAEHVEEWKRLTATKATEKLSDELLPLPAAPLTVQTVEGEPRILDTDLAERLGFDRLRDIRKLIARHEDALGALGTRATVAHRPERGGHAVEEFYLNRKQAIFITAKSDTPQATEITIEIIEKFDALGALGVIRTERKTARNRRTENV